MLATGSAMFLMIPNAANERVLHPGKVLDSDAAGFAAEFEEAIAPSIGADLLAFAETRGKFFQQGTRVLEICQADGQQMISFARVGEPVSAEKRQAYRVSVVMEKIVARVGKDSNCAVMDISPDGFGAIVRGQLAIGSLVDISFECEGQTISATARVQTIRPRIDGKFRYGFLVSGKNSPARKALEQISASIQRAQLRRLAGAA